uniref:(northern house mosquito) hypothetical protein n=1 Tax=Culex pipiens TaxID=7175 RepID=A0A8D8GLS2_CULPI
MVMQTTNILQGQQPPPPPPKTPLSSSPSRGRRRRRKTRSTVPGSRSVAATTTSSTGSDRRGRWRRAKWSARSTGSAGWKWSRRAGRRALSAVCTASGTRSLGPGPRLVRR